MVENDGKRKNVGRSRKIEREGRERECWDIVKICRRGREREREWEELREWVRNIEERERKIE
jgi:hypothetical protein